MLKIREDHRSFYERMGGEAPIRELVERFYDIMDSDDSARRVRAMHPSELTGSRMKLYEFLVGWMGGPPLYMNKYGHPRLRMRHLPFAIDSDARDQWMHCMGLAMKQQGLDPALRKDLESALFQVADFMRNREDA
ncbi:MAG: group II truncated hemoglobin [Pseudomonadota bacterium]